MFTGIVEAMATVAGIEKEGSNLHFTLETPLATEFKIDQSVGHNGVCLTVVALGGNGYTVTAIDSIFGCTSQREVSVTELYACPEELFGVPNVFSPNGDGVNDVLELKLSPTVQDIISFQIFNRWGALVYQTDDRFDGWDGTLNGRPMGEGVYIYVLEVVCPVSGEVIMKRGDITILK